MLPTGGISAVFLYYIKLMNARHKIRRESRGDELDVLNDHIARLEAELKEVKAKLEAIQLSDRQEVNDLKTKLTAAWIERERLTVQEKYLLERNRELARHNKVMEERMEALNAEVAELRRGGANAPNSAG